MAETFVHVNVTWSKVYAKERGALRIHKNRGNFQHNLYVNIELILPPDFRLSVKRPSLETWNSLNSGYFWDKCPDWLTLGRMDSLFQRPVCCLQEGWLVWRVCSPVRTHQEYYQRQGQEVGTQRNCIFLIVECGNCFERIFIGDFHTFMKTVLCFYFLKAEYSFKPVKIAAVLTLYFEILDALYWSIWTLRLAVNIVLYEWEMSMSITPFINVDLRNWQPSTNPTSGHHSGYCNCNW